MNYNPCGLNCPYSVKAGIIPETLSMLKLTGGVKVTQMDNFSGSISGVFERSSVKTAYEIQSLATTMFPLKINPEFDRKK